VVIGAGFTGLGAAIILARSGQSVLVLDKDAPGSGASSRNGGIASGNIRWSYSSLIKRIGKSAAQAIYRESVDARNDLRDFIETENIDCDYQLCGRFSGAMNVAGLDRMKREAEILNEEIGIPSEIVEPVDQHQEIGSTLYAGGVIRPDIGGLHPAKLHRGMLEVAKKSRRFRHRRARRNTNRA
jgi:glycine/D-amino acid oxidase-like deaminating enzyme